MKKTLLIVYVFLLTGCLVVRAQVPANSSRLNLAKKTPTVAFDRPTLVAKASVLSYKPLALDKPQTLNEYYRSLMFANPVASSATESASVKAISVENSEKVATGISDKTRGPEDHLYSSDRITVSNIYPNPASDYAQFDYSIQGSVRDARMIFYNVLMSQVSEFSLDKNDRKLIVNTREMPTGVYFYQLSVDGKKVATKKMLVRHQQ